MKLRKSFSFCTFLFISTIFLTSGQSIVNNLEVNSYTQGISISSVFYWSISSKIGSDSIRGRVKINDEYFNVMCDCNGKRNFQEIIP